MAARFLIARCFVSLSLLLTCRAVAVFAAPVPKREKPTAKDIEKAQEQIKEKFSALQGRAAAPLVHVADEPVGRAFPKALIYTAIFRQYPVARVPPKPLKAQNVFVVHPDGKIVHLTNIKELEKFFRTNLLAVRSAGAAKDAAKAWLKLSETFKQDGFFKFSMPDNEIKVEDDGKKVSGKSVVEPTSGNKGEIAVTLTFDDNGKLTKVEEKSKVLAGIRPRCQATKLLDADAVIRAMAEQDILVMGRSAEEYLDEQRAKAGSELKKAIDRVWKRIVAEDR